MTIQEMKQRKRELGYSNEQLSALSGVPLGTIMKIFGGATRAPRRATIEALERVLSADGPRSESVREHTFVYDHMTRMTQDEVDPGLLQKPHRLYTIDDYYALPNDIRTELIDGVFYDMGSPSVTHQLIIGELHLQLKSCEKQHNRRCRVILSPCDVQLDQDRYTMVQPDLLVVCDPEKIKGRNCFGAPDLVMEVLSPASRSHDCVLKLNKYQSSGIREYWIIDPDHRQVITYVFDDPAHPSFRTWLFTDHIPIHISGGDCEVDMNEVLAALIA